MLPKYKVTLAQETVVKCTYTVNTNAVNYSLIVTTCTVQTYEYKSLFVSIYVPICMDSPGHVPH